MDGLPDQEQDEELSEEERMAAQEQVRQDRLNALGQSLAKSRSECIEARQLSGIEAEWTEDEEYYEGIDDANRGEMKAWQTKPPGQQDISTNNSTQSTIFPNITRPYTDTSSAKLGDMLNPNDDRAWELKETAIPDLIKIAAGEVPTAISAQLEQQEADPEKRQEQAALLIDQAQKDIAEAAAKAKKAQTRIDDWHMETDYATENRRVIKDCVKYGTGILKGPIPQKRTSVVLNNGEMERAEKIIPGSVRVSVWNCYPDAGVGDDIQSGTCHWERDDISYKKLHLLKGMVNKNGEPIYIDSQIDAVLQEGPHAATKEFEAENKQNGLVRRDTKNLFEIWYMYGDVSYDDLEACGCEFPEEVSRQERYFVQITMVNNRVIKAAFDPLDGTDFPYDYMVYQEREGLPWGIGLPRQIRPAQNMIKGAVRNMMDNAGLGGGPMWVYFPGLITPLNGVAELKPRKGWIAAENADPQSLKDAFYFIEFPIMQNELEAIINLGLRFAETITGLPMMLQGQEGSGPDTLGGQQMANNNASTTHRAIARNYDDRITIPQIRRYYDYILLHGEDDEKGDYEINARGSAVLVERDIQAQTVIQLGSLVGNPIYGKDPKKWADELLKSWRFDSKKFDYDDDEWRKIVEGLAQQAQKGDVRLEVEQMRGQQRAQENDKARAFNAAMKQFDAFITTQAAQGVRSIELDKIRASFNELNQKLKTQIMLSGSEVVKPPVEPQGRAQAGQSFAQ